MKRCQVIHVWPKGFEERCDGIATKVVDLGCKHEHIEYELKVCASCYLSPQFCSDCWDAGHTDVPVKMIREAALDAADA